MLLIGLTAVAAVIVVANALPTPNSNDGGPIGELPENWDQTKDDTQSLFLNKSDKNDLEPYPLALSEEGNSEGFEQAVGNGELDNLLMRRELYGEPPAIEGLSSGYDSRRRKRGSGTKVGGAGAATKVATKSGSGKKNRNPEEEALSPIELLSHDSETLRSKRGTGMKVGNAPGPFKSETYSTGLRSKRGSGAIAGDAGASPLSATLAAGHRSKRGSGTKVGGAAASAKSATKNSGGNKKNFRPISERRKRDSSLSAADVRALLNLWEAQERRKQEWNGQWAADRYYNRMNPEEDQPEVDENGDIWYNEPVVINPRERDYPHPSYFSEQNRVAVPRPYPEMYAMNQMSPTELAQRYEEVRRKRQYANKMKRFMVARKRSDSAMIQQNNYRPRDDLYTLAELLRSAPRVQEQDIPVYRRLIL